MIFNCLNCCKAISSLRKSCPFCMIELVEAIEKVGVETKALPLDQVSWAPATSRQALATRLTGAADKTLTTIAQILHLRRAKKV